MDQLNLPSNVLEVLKRSKCHTFDFPKASKSWLVVKEEKLQMAEDLFRGTEINITTVGRKYLGGFVGTEEGRRKYFEELCGEWCSQLEVLSKIARTEPQAAYSAFTAGFKHKLTYFVRTIPFASELLKPLDELINTKFIPAITENQVVSEETRKLFFSQKYFRFSYPSSRT